MALAEVCCGRRGRVLLSTGLSWKTGSTGRSLLRSEWPGPSRYWDCYLCSQGDCSAALAGVRCGLSDRVLQWLAGLSRRRHWR